MNTTRRDSSRDRGRELRHGRRAEALLTLPGSETADNLIAEKIAFWNDSRHGRSP